MKNTNSSEPLSRVVPFVLAIVAFLFSFSAFELATHEAREQKLRACRAEKQLAKATATVADLKAELAEVRDTEDHVAVEKEEPAEEAVEKIQPVPECICQCGCGKPEFSCECCRRRTKRK